MSQAILFVHGAFHGPWCWEPVVTRLEARGIPCRCVELYRGGLDADVAAIRAEIDTLVAEGHEVVVVGHSLGCVSVSSLAPERIAHVVFLAGPLAGPGLPDASTCTGPDFLSAVTFHSDGSMEIDPERARELFYHDCSEACARTAVAKLRPNLSYGPELPTGTPLYAAVPSTYLWCDDDRAVRPEYQHQVAKVTGASEGFATSHSPMLSAPDALTDALLRVLART